MPLSPVRLVSAALPLVDDAEEARTPHTLVDRFVHRVSAPSDVSAPGERIHHVCPTDWSAAFVHHVGYWSHFEPRSGYSAWPLPPARTAAELAAFAEARGVLRDEAPEYGDVYVLWSPVRKAFVRTGIVLAVTRAELRGRAVHYHCLTIDGDSNRQGAVHGASTLLVERRLVPAKGDRVVRWVELGWSDRETTSADAPELDDLFGPEPEERAA